MRVVLFTGAVCAAALALAACGGHPSAVAPQGGQGAAAASDTSSPASYDDRRDAPVPQVNGKPMWAANRKHTAAENAQYQFTKNGEEFGANSESDYVTKVHAFVDSPPTDAQTIDRSNGDRLIYAPASNTFAVVSRDGAPRTMFKPRDGSSYWSQQKQRESERGKSDSGGNQS
jgi:pyocin large subunit-like protein